MKTKPTTMIVAMLAVTMAAMLAFAETTTQVDDLSGLRPDTQGVETNAFWDTRAHLTYTVQSSLGASTNVFDTSVLTVAASNVGDVGGQKGFILIVQ
jgi:hypothetical protein